MHTLSAAVHTAKQTLLVSPVVVREPITPSQPTERLPLGTPVVLANGVDAVISGHSTADCNRYRVSWFNRQIWQVQHKWIERGSLQGVYLQKQTAEAVASAVA